MHIVVPTTEAEINAAHEGDRLIDDDALFVMRPKENTGWRVLGMSEDFDVGILAVLSENVLGSADREPARPP